MLKVENVSITLDNKKILNNINIDFLNGTSTAIIGESGSGKTTLAKIIIGMLSADEGKIELDNKVLGTLKRRSFDICAKIQYIFQDPYSALDNKFTVRQTLNEPVKMCDRHKHNHLSIEEALSFVDEKLLMYIDKEISTLSGGQRQKVCIARALITMPEIIITDESTSMLDEKSSKEIMSLLDKIKIEKNICIISILHNIDLKNDKWDIIAVFNNGEIVEYMDYNDFYENCEHEYSKKLIDAYNYFN